MAKVIDAYNGLSEAIKSGFTVPVHYYTDDAGVETDWVLGFTPLVEENGESEDVLVLNYCPFCRTRLVEGKPTCGGRLGARTETERAVDVG